MSTKKKPAEEMPRTGEETAPQEKKTWAVTGEPLNFRKGPGLKHEAMRILQKDEKIAVRPELEENGYVPAETADGVSGYVDKRYIRVI